MEQLKLIDKVKSQAYSDDNISAVLMYGSFTKGEGDQYSDVEFYVFIKDMDIFNSREWVSNIRPIELFFTNEYGTEVAVFDNLIRGEFHFHSVSEIDVVKSWEGFMSFENADKMNLVDKDGLLSEALSSIEIISPDRNNPEDIQWIAESLINLLIMTGNLIKRKEIAHAQQSFFFIQRNIILLMRIENNSTKHWENPTKKLEEEIPHTWYEKFSRTIPVLNIESLQSSFAACLSLCNELFERLNVPKHLRELLKRID